MKLFKSKPKNKVFEKFLKRSINEATMKIRELRETDPEKTKEWQIRYSTFMYVLDTYKEM